MTSSASEDRWVYPTEGADPRDADAVKDETLPKRTGTHPQERERSQGTSADSPGFDPSDRERADQASAPEEEGPADLG